MDNSSTNSKILGHKELKKIVQGKTVLHLNSLGKDSAVCLEWLSSYSGAKKITALYFDFLSKNPDDELYLNWQKKRYPNVEFISYYNPHELSNITDGIYQTPETILGLINKFEHTGFSMNQVALDIKKELNADFICRGESKYESVTRASNFYKNGIYDHSRSIIYPIGLMTKEEIFSIIKQTDIKLHPCYKLVPSGYDALSYWKMRSAFIKNPEYKNNVLKAFPMLELDIYRWECLLKGKQK